MAEVSIAPLVAEHWPAVARIYAEGIATGDATFETEVPTWERFDTGHLREHRYVAIVDDEVAGWIACSPTSDRCVYGGVVENSVYVAAAVRGRGIGSILIAAVVESTEQAGIWTIETGIFPENEASIRLHQKAGFELVGRRKRLGEHHGVWRDVLLLERRSDEVG